MNRLVRIFLLLIAALLPMGAGAQMHTVVMSSGTTTVSAFQYPQGVIYDNGGAAGEYSNSFSGTVIIAASVGDTIHVWGSYETEASYDRLTFYNTNSTSGTPIATRSGTGSVDLISTTGYMTVNFYSDASMHYDGFELHWELYNSGCTNGVYAISASDVKATELDLSWTARNPAGNFRIIYGGVDTVVSGTSYHATGLFPMMTYHFMVSSVNDAGSAACSRSLNVMTTQYPAEVLGLRNLCGTGDTVWLTAAEADHYYWNTGETSQTIGITDTGDYCLVAYTGWNNSVADTACFTISHQDLDIVMDIPSVLCPGDSALIYVGTTNPATVRVRQGESTLSEAERVFLPDGVNCPPHGCSYRSELQFSGFANSARITNVNDIRYVMLNMEHSYAGDLYINITCPNNQKADIMRYGGTGSSDCNSSILSSSRGWRGSSLASSGTYFGNAYDYSDSYSPCDSNALSNAPGIGWRYCWSNCLDAGYQYAQGDGIIYRNWNVTGNSFDSSNVAQGTQFYHPDDSFDNLIGCPMNGTWYIEVIDGWSADNGYIFGWELALNPNRLRSVQYHFHMNYAILAGPFATRVNDTIFNIVAPTDLDHDTVGTYLLTILDSSGCSFDTAFTILFRATAVSHVYDTIVENQAATWRYNGALVQHDTTDMLFRLHRTSGCDSLVYYNLHVWPNVDTTVTLRYCANQMQLYDHDTSIVLHTSHGADSSVLYHIELMPTYNYTIFDTICDNVSIFFAGDSLSQSGIYSDSSLTVQMCDSITTLVLMVNPTYNLEFTDTLMYDEPVTFDGHELTEPGEYVYRYTTSSGCDSLRTLHLVRHPIIEWPITDSICSGDTLFFYDLVLTQAGVYSDTAFSAVLSRPDTIMVLTLIEVSRPTLAIDAEYFCGDTAHYLLTARTEVPYLHWSYEDLHDSVIYVPNPDETLAVSLLADYREAPLCPISASVTLEHIKVLDAVIEARPTAITTDNRELKAYNRSRGPQDSHFWRVYFDNILFLDNETTDIIQFNTPLNIDSIVLFLHVENDMCQDSDRVVVDILTSDILFPNVITPTQATNQYFRCYSYGVLDYELWIFDRRGDIVFHTTDINATWNGVCKGHESQQEAFVYKCRYRTETIVGWQTKVGTVTVLR